MVMVIAAFFGGVISGQLGTAWDTNDIGTILLLTGVPAFFLLLTVLVITYTAEWTFDQSSGYITARRRCKPFPRLTTRISKTDIQSVDISSGEAEGFREWKLSIRTSRKKLKLTVRDWQTANLLAQRIKEFTWPTH
jgi:hypothetical protein